jgi:transcriptional antiterminator NusG
VRRSKAVTTKMEKLIKDKVYFPGYVIEANLIGEIPHIIKGITSVIGFLGETKAVSQFL